MHASDLGSTQSLSNPAATNSRRTTLFKPTNASRNNLINPNKTKKNVDSPYIVFLELACSLSWLSNIWSWHCTPLWNTLIELCGLKIGGMCHKVDDFIMTETSKSWQTVFFYAPWIKWRAAIPNNLDLCNVLSWFASQSNRMTRILFVLKNNF